MPQPTPLRVLLDNFSLEMTGKDVAALHEAAPAIAPGTRINVTFLATEDLRMRVTAAQTVKDLGFIPVPHISARRLHSEAELREFLHALVEVDAAQHLFAVGGDPTEPLGPYTSALEIIRSGIFAEFGVQDVSIAGYPEGHPDIPNEVLWRELRDKLDELTQQHLEAVILTQFGFEVEPVVTWLNQLADHDISAPVRIGVPGPAGIKRLLGYARRFGVASSASIVKKYGFSVTNLMGSAGPDKFLTELGAQATAINFQGEVGVHFYTFGGMAKTAEWARNFTAGLN